MRLSKECELLIDGYLARFRKCLAKNAIAQQDEIVREILMHIRECAEQPGVNVESVLRRLGPAEVLASQYGSEQLIRRAERAFSPLVILKATLELAKRGLMGSVLFLFALIGYMTGGGLIFTAMLKPFYPRQIGLWAGAGFYFGYHEPAPPDGIHELLGNAYIPVTLCLGGLILCLTTLGMRWMIRRWKQPARGDSRFPALTTA